MRAIKSQHLSMALLALLCIVSFMPVSSFAVPRPADSDINYWVKDALRHDDRVDIAHIRVTTREGIMVLSGHVENLAAKNYAEREAKKINGVFGVVNKLAYPQRGYAKLCCVELVGRELRMLRTL